MSVDLYKKVPVKVQKKSGFDKSHQNLFTSKVGTITPIMVDELIPNSTVNLDAAITAALPPLASDTFMRCTLKYASFFVPTRLLVQGYESWLTGKDNVYSGTGVSGASVEMPVLKLSLKNAEPGSLADFLGVKADYSDTHNNANQITVNALPFLAYHRIYDDWFRNSMIQNPIFSDAYVSQTGNNYLNFNATTSKFKSPVVYSYNGTYIDKKTLDDTVLSDSYTAKSVRFLDGSYLYNLRQANFGIDLFTSCSPNPQNGNAQAVSFTIAGSADAQGDVTGSGNFTISALRAANSMQQFLERNNLAGNRLVDYVKAQYGASLSDGVAQRPILLGSGKFDVYNKSIYQTNVDDAQTISSNPFVTVGAKYGSAFAEGSTKLVNNFTAMEPGYLMVLAWLSPKVTYSTGVDPILSRYVANNSQSDLANPILQNVGNEPVFQSQLNVVKYLQNATDVFGYNERYCQWKDKMDGLHGIMRDGSSLESFALQRSFGSLPGTISTQFLQIPTNYLDQVAAVNGDISTYGYWCDTFFKYGVSMPLARYAVPSLQDPAYEHGEDVIIDKNGKQLA